MSYEILMILDLSEHEILMILMILDLSEHEILIDIVWYCIISQKSHGEACRVCHEQRAILSPKVLEKLMRLKECGYVSKLSPQMDDIERNNGT
jgi:hypothetical protein